MSFKSYPDLSLNVVRNINSVLSPGNRTTVSPCPEIPRDVNRNPHDFDQLAQIKVAVLLTIFLFTTIANFYVFVVTFSRRRRKQSLFNLFIAHLCVADLLVGLFCMLGEAMWAVSVQWRAGNIACKLFKFSQTFSATLTTSLICVISVDRALIVLMPMSHRGQSGYRARLFLVVAWVWSAAENLPQLWLFEEARAPFEEPFYQCVHLSLTRNLPAWQNQFFFWTHYASNYLVPLALIIITYVLILVKLQAASRNTFGAESSIDSSSQIPSGMRHNRTDGLSLTENDNHSQYRYGNNSAIPSDDAASYLASRQHNAHSGVSRLACWKAPHHLPTGNESQMLRYHHDSIDTANISDIRLTNRTQFGTSAHSKRLVSTGSNVTANRNTVYRRAKIKSIQMSFLIVLSFLLCWTPYYIVYLMNTLVTTSCPQAHNNRLVYIFFFGQLSGVLNPLIYGAFHCTSSCKRRL